MSTQSFTSHLKFTQFNVENLFLYLDGLNGQDLDKITETEWRSLTHASTPNKPLYKTKALAKTLLDIDPDFVTINEVGGIESLENFNRLFLKSQFEVLLKEGNSPRGIDVGFLVKKSLPLRFLLISHKDRPLGFLYPHEEMQDNPSIKSHFFSRDVAELRVFRPNQSTPALVVLATHLKSKLDPDNIDPQGRRRRQAELNCLVDIYLELKKELGPTTPIIVGGDFNGIAQPAGEAEFENLFLQTDLKDILELNHTADRTTQWQFPNYGAPRGLQLDYLFLSQELHSEVLHEQSGVYRFKDDLGNALPAPKSQEQVQALPSDHYPVIATIKNSLF